MIEQYLKTHYNLPYVKGLAEKIQIIGSQWYKDNIQG